MAAAALVTTVPEETICALCLEYVFFTGDDLIRRENINQLFHYLKETQYPLVKAEMKSTILQMESVLKDQKKVTLCTKCNLEVATVLRGSRLCNEYEKSVLYQQQNLIRDSSNLLQQNVAFMNELSRLRESTLNVNPSRLETHPSLGGGIRLVRSRLSELADGLQERVLEMQQGQLHADQRVFFGNLPLQYQPPMESSKPGGCRTGVVAQFYPNVQPGLVLENQGLEVANLPGNSTATSVAVPSFKWRIVSGIRKNYTGHHYKYDEINDRFTLGDVLVKVDEEKRALICGECNLDIKAKASTKEESIPPKLRFAMKKHVFEQHTTKFSFPQCTICNMHFLSENALHKHVTSTDGCVPEQKKSPSKVPAVLVGCSGNQGRIQHDIASDVEMDSE